MRTHQYNDPFLKFKSTVEIGKYLVSVEIEGLGKGEFAASGLANFIQGDARGSATLLGFHTHDAWKIQLNDLHTMQRIIEVLTLRGQPALAKIVESHVAQALLSNNLEAYWQKILTPCLLRQARTDGQVLDDSFSATMAWCNPVISRHKLHPRAMRFIETHWPKIVEMHSVPDPALGKLA